MRRSAPLRREWSTDGEAGTATEALRDMLRRTSSGCRAPSEKHDQHGNADDEQDRPQRDRQGDHVEAPRGLLRLHHVVLNDGMVRVWAGIGTWWPGVGWRSANGRHPHGSTPLVLLLRLLCHHLAHHLVGHVGVLRRHRFVRVHHAAIGAVVPTHVIEREPSAAMGAGLNWFVHGIDSARGQKPLVDPHLAAIGKRHLCLGPSILRDGGRVLVAVGPLHFDGATRNEAIAAA